MSRVLSCRAGASNAFPPASFRWPRRALLGGARDNCREHLPFALASVDHALSCRYGDQPPKTKRGSSPMRLVGRTSAGQAKESAAALPPKPLRCLASEHA